MATIAELRALCDRHKARGQLSTSLQWTRPLTAGERESGHVVVSPGLVSKYARPHFNGAILSFDTDALDRWLAAAERQQTWPVAPDGQPGFLGY